MALSEKAKSILKWGGIAVGAGVAGFIAYKALKKKSAPLSGVGRISYRKRKTTRKRKKQAVLRLK